MKLSLRKHRVRPEPHFSQRQILLGVLVLRLCRWVACISALLVVVACDSLGSSSNDESTHPVWCQDFETTPTQCGQALDYASTDSFLKEDFARAIIGAGSEEPHNSVYVASNASQLPILEMIKDDLSSHTPQEQPTTLNFSNPTAATDQFDQASALGTMAVFLQDLTDTGGHRILASGYGGDGIAALFIQALDHNTDLSLGSPDADYPLIIVLSAGAVLSEDNASPAPSLDEGHIAILHTNDYIVTVASVEKNDFVGNSLVQTAGDATHTALACKWTQDYCIAAPWKINLGGQELEGAEVSVLLAAVTLDMIWSIWPDLVREEVIEIFLSCGVDLGIDDDGIPDGVDSFYGHGLLLPHCLFDSNGVLKDQELFLGSGSLQSQAASLAWSVQGLDRYGRNLNYSGVAAGGPLHTPFSASLQATRGRGWAMYLSPLTATRTSSLMAWSSRRFWGFTAANLGMAGYRWNIDPHWRVWTGVGKEWDAFAGVMGTGSWQLGETWRWQTALDGMYRLDGNWGLQTGITLGGFDHAPASRSVVGRGRGTMAEIWLSFYTKQLRFGVQLNSGLHGHLQVQREERVFHPQPQISMNLNWLF